MLKITPQAAAQIRHAARQGKMEGMALRIAARSSADGGIEYGMGFDDIKEDDLHLVCEDVDLVIGVESKALLNGAVMDYVELEPGEFRFIFMNPNDPNYVPPDSAAAPGASGDDGGAG